ncbi:Hypothetical_protein [Hexamita inflata]|uniref:Hypothetical_protein n=1 Tax=Hexamita inflata TaxID=28002 RepID=A0AA86P6A3_9EUKA|nr:Hypothetical protein HINF_LOCUS20329 [Hexamita inflata]
MLFNENQLEVIQSNLQNFSQLVGHNSALVLVSSNQVFTANFSFQNNVPSITVNTQPVYIGTKPYLIQFQNNTFIFDVGVSNKLFKLANSEPLLINEFTQEISDVKILSSFIVFSSSSKQFVLDLSSDLQLFENNTIIPIEPELSCFGLLPSPLFFKHFNINLVQWLSRIIQVGAEPYQQQFMSFLSQTENEEENEQQLLIRKEVDKIIGASYQIGEPDEFSVKELEDDE